MDKAMNDLLRNFKIAFAVVVTGITLWFVFHLIGVIKVEGNEAVVKQHIQKGVVPEVLLSGTHFYVGFIWDMYKYNIGTQKTTFDSPGGNTGAEYDRIVVDCGDNGGQKVWVSMSINYRIGWEADNQGNLKFSPEKLVALHKDGIGKTYEDVIIKRTVVDVVNKIARPYNALEIYSGQGFIDFKEKVDKELKNHPVFRARGIYVENTVIYKNSLGDAYEAEIAAKQLAIQQGLRKQEETRASQEEAKRIFAESQAGVEKVRQEAEARKIAQVKSAEANAEQSVLQAEAEKKRKILDAEGQRDANLAQASGILAVGKAEAEVDSLKREALYGGESGAWRARVEIAGLQAEKLRGMFAGVQIVPEQTILRAGEGAGAITGVSIPAVSSSK